MRRNKRSLISVSLAALVITAVGIIGQVTDSSLRIATTDQQEAETNSELVTTREAFVRSLVGARVSGGLVWESNCGSEENKLQRGVLTLSLREALDRITQTDLQYQWQSERGAINLLPTTGEPDLLKIRTREFRAENTSLNLILEQLLALPEVRADPTGRRVNQGLRYGGLSSPDPERVRVNVRDVTLREVLNSIVRAHGRAVWAYTERHCNGQDTFTIDFLVQ